MDLPSFSTYIPAVMSPPTKAETDGSSVTFPTFSLSSEPSRVLASVNTGVNGYAPMLTGDVPLKICSMVVFPAAARDFISQSFGTSFSISPRTVSTRHDCMADSLPFFAASIRLITSAP